MELRNIVCDIADVLKSFDSEKPIHKRFKPGIGPFGEPQLIKEVSSRLNRIKKGYETYTRRTPDLDINGEWAVEIKIVRPFGDNGNVAENWSVKLLHPYEGNTSLIGDALKLLKLEEFPKKAIFLIAYEHTVPKIDLNVLITSFELIIQKVIGLRIGERIEEKRANPVHPEHQTVRCLAWELV